MGVGGVGKGAHEGRLYGGWWEKGEGMGSRPRLHGGRLYAGRTGEGFCVVMVDGGKGAHEGRPYREGVGRVGRRATRFLEGLGMTWGGTRDDM